MTIAALPDPVPKHLPPGFVALPDHALEGTNVPLAAGPPIMPVQGPMTSRMRQYVLAFPSVEGLNRGPVVRVDVSHASSFPPEWFEGLTGTPVEISGWGSYYRASGNEVSLIILRGQWVVEVMTAGVSEAETLAVAHSLDFV